MKAFLFILLLWTLAISQMINSVPVKADSNQKLARIENNSSTLHSSKDLICREDVSARVFFEWNTQSLAVDLNCDQKQSDQLIKTSEARDRHEYNVGISLSHHEVTLAGSNFTQ